MLDQMLDFYTVDDRNEPLVVGYVLGVKLFDLFGLLCEYVDCILGNFLGLTCSMPLRAVNSREWDFKLPL